MLKKIDVDQLRIGMYIHELCCAWLDTPFWQKSFRLENRGSLDKIRKCGIREAWIDTGKGLDVSPETVTATSPPDEEQVPVPVSRGAFNKIARVSSAKEQIRAAKIVAKSRQAVFSMFTEARMGNAIEADNAMPLVEEIASSVMRNPGALISLARLKTADDYTYMHSVAVCALMIALARQLKLDDGQIRAAGLAGLLHDIGKMAIPPDILNKQGKLSETEFETVRKHPVIGHQMLLNATGVGEVALDVCLHHHEKIDGSGYPDRLAGEQISLYARMGAVCDVYDAITSDRPYKQGWCPAESLRKMAEWRSGHFDEVIFQAFVKSIGIYPVGTLVRLESGRLGMVVEQAAGKSLLQPSVRVFFSTRSAAYITPELVELGAPGVRDKVVTHEDAGKWGLKDLDRYWLRNSPGQGAD